MGVKEKGTFQFNIDTCEFLNEIVNCSLRENQGILKIPLNVFKNLLFQVAERAIEIDDPKMNILMLRLGLYEVHPMDVPKTIEIIQKQLENELSENQKP